MKRVREVNINTQQNWDAIYATPESARRWTQWGAEDLVQCVVTAILPGETVLDVATGAGIGPERMDKFNRNITWWGVDSSVAAIRFLRKHNAVDWRMLLQWDVTAGPLPLQDGCADVVLCTELIEHVEEPHKLIKELMRLARRAVIITTPRENVVDTEYHIWSFTVEDVHAFLQPYGAVVTSLARSRRQIVGVCIKEKHNDAGTEA